MHWVNSCPWAGLEDVESATVTYVDWFNPRRLHGQITDGCGHTTPAAFEADNSYQNVRTAQAGDSTNEPL